jgi:Flp pilus assembly protein TadG
MATLTLRRLVSAEHGAELIEMAVVTPILLLLVMGIVDFGFMFQRYVVLTNAAVEGARVATLPGYDPTVDGPARAQAYATNGGVPLPVPANCALVNLPGAGGGTWPGVTCTVQHVYRMEYIGPIVALVGGTTAANVTLTGRSTMRRQLGS